MQATLTAEFGDAAIPLQKWASIYFPMTPKSTIHFWATQAFFRGEGPLAGRIRRIGGRWYVLVGSSDGVVSGIVDSIIALAKGAVCNV